MLTGDLEKARRFTRRLGAVAETLISRHGTEQGKQGRLPDSL